VSSGEGQRFLENDLWVLRYYMVGAMGSMLFSATYHCLFCHSEHVGKFCLKLDYLGIVLNITSTGISAIYFAFQSASSRQTTLNIYIGTIALCGLAAFWVVLDPIFHGPKAAKWRLIIFGILYSSCYIPIVHAYLADDVDTTEYPILFLTSESIMHIVGAFFYVTRIPERYFPGSFDIWGASHQLFHILIAMSQIIRLLAIRVSLLQHRVLN